MKIKVLFDSTVSYSKAEIESKGAAFVPLIVTVDGKDYFDGIDIDENKLAALMNEGDHEFRTAATPLGMLEEAYREALKDADAVVFLPLSKELSSTNQNAKVVADQEEFKGKVFVVDSLYASP
jgi:DegV family protein with EDD domain